jgi:hypothetical protein
LGREQGEGGERRRLKVGVKVIEECLPPKTTIHLGFK